MYWLLLVRVMVRTIPCTERCRKFVRSVYLLTIPCKYLLFRVLLVGTDPFSSSYWP